MKKIIWIFIVIYNIGNGQRLNYLENSGFESVNLPFVGYQCTTKIQFYGGSGFGEFDKVNNWKSRTKIIDQSYTSYLVNPSVTGNMCAIVHSPDIYNNSFSARTGNFYVEGSNLEMFYQKIYNNIKSGSYTIHGFLKPSEPNIDNLTGIKLQFLFSNEEFEFKSEDDPNHLEECHPDYALFNNDIDFYNDYLLNTGASTNIGKNKYVNFEIETEYRCDIDEYNIDWFGLNPTKSNNLFSGSFCYSGSTYIMYDDITVSKSTCFCPEEIFKENIIHADKTKVQASQNIFAGYEAGSASVNGPVIVDIGKKVSYKAGNSIKLLPGFHAKAGSNFTAKIAPCTLITNKPKIIRFAEIFTPNGDDTNDLWGADVEDATDWEVHIYDRWGNAYAMFCGKVPEDGKIRHDISYWDMPEGSFMVYLELSNCGNLTTFEGKVVTIVDDNTISYKKNTNANNLFSKDVIPSNINYIRLYNNFENKVLNYHLQETENSHVKVLDQLGKILYSIDVTRDEYLKTYSYDYSNLAPGTYFLMIQNNKNVFSEKFLVR